MGFSTMVVWTDKKGEEKIEKGEEEKQKEGPVCTLFPGRHNLGVSPSPAAKQFGQHEEGGEEEKEAKKEAKKEWYLGFPTSSSA